MSNEGMSKCGGCGPGWLNIGRRDFFYPCCLPHDEQYKISAEVYAKGVLLNSAEDKLNGLQLKQLADHHFFKCLKKTSAERGLLARFMFHLVGVFYSGSIVIYSDRYWARMVTEKLRVTVLDDLAKDMGVEAKTTHIDPFVEALNRED